MIRRDFKWVHSSDMGSGWLPMFMGENADVAALPAHDILDHRPGDMPTFAQEMVALGRGLYTRGMVSRYAPLERNSTTDPAEILGGDIGSDMLLQERWNDRDVVMPDRRPNWRKLPEDVAQVIRRTVEIAEESLWAHERPYQEADRSKSLDWVAKATLTQDEAQAIGDYLATGWLDAHRRYGPSIPDAYQMAQFFESIDKAFDHTEEGRFDGDQVRIKLNLREMTIQLGRAVFDDYGRVSRFQYEA